MGRSFFMESSTLFKVTKVASRQWLPSPLAQVGIDFFRNLMLKSIMFYIYSDHHFHHLLHASNLYLEFTLKLEIYGHIYLVSTVVKKITLLNLKLGFQRNYLYRIFYISQLLKLLNNNILSDYAKIGSWCLVFLAFKEVFDLVTCGSRVNEIDLRILTHYDIKARDVSIRGFGL